MGVTPPPAPTKEQPKEDDRFVTIGYGGRVLVGILLLAFSDLFFAGACGYYYIGNNMHNNNKVHDEQCAVERKWACSTLFPLKIDQFQRRHPRAAGAEEVQEAQHGRSPGQERRDQGGHGHTRF